MQFFLIFFFIYQDSASVADCHHPVLPGYAVFIYTPLQNSLSIEAPCPPRRTWADRECDLFCGSSQCSWFPTLAQLLEQGPGKSIGVKALQVLGLLSEPNILDRELEIVTYTHHDPALSCAIEFCKDDTRNLNGLMKEFDL